LTAAFHTETIFILFVKATYFNEEVNCTDPSFLFREGFLYLQSPSVISSWLMLRKNFNILKKTSTFEVRLGPLRVENLPQS
jgi:hypothetical protein